MIDAQDLRRVLICHAHDRLEDDEKEAAQYLAAVEVRARSGATTGAIAHFHHPGLDQGRETDERVAEGVTGFAGDILRTILLITIQAIGALIFSGVAMHTMNVV